MTPSTTPELADSSPSVAAFTSRLRSAAMAANTRRAYTEGWAIFTDWCAAHAVPPLSATPDNLVDFFVAAASRRRAGTDTLLAFGTLILVRCAIRRRYADANLTSPTHHPDVTAIFKGLARLRGTAPPPSVHGTRPCWR